MNLTLAAPTKSVWREYDEALRGAVERVAGGEHEALVADLTHDLHVARVDDLGSLDPIGEGRVGHLQGHGVAAVHRVDVAEGGEVCGPMAGDAHGPAIEEAGGEAVGADPDRLGTLLPHLQGISAVCWLAGDSPRLEALAETLVDTHARGIVCEPGPGAEAARRVAAGSNVGFEIVADAAEMAVALDRILAC